MMPSESGVIVSANVREYFNEQINLALSKQALAIDSTTTVYLVNLLSAYTDARELFEETEDGLCIRPLAMHYADALSAPTSSERNSALRRLGDIALFISGLFSGSLNRKVVDIDYYIAMGGAAYGQLHDGFAGRLGKQAFSVLFAELAEKFSDLVDVLGEVGERSHLNSNSDVLRLYEVWLRSGSQRAFEKLRALGLHPSTYAASMSSH